MMLCRMDVMLMSISGISNEKDPTKRLEVCTMCIFISPSLLCFACEFRTKVNAFDFLSSKF